LFPIRKTSVAVLLFSIVLSGQICAGPGEEGQLLNGLRERGLFEIAEYHCRNQLGREGLTSRERMQWTVEMVRTMAQEALNLPADQQESAWNRAVDTARRYVTVQATQAKSFTIPVATQAALILAKQGEFLRLEAVVARDPAAKMQGARDKLRVAAKKLNDLLQEVDVQLTMATSKVTDEALSQQELISIKQRLSFYLGNVYRNQAVTYPLDGGDRVAAMQRAIAALKKPLSQLAAEDGLVVDIKIGLIGCHRELGQWTAAVELLELLQKSTLEPSLQLRLRSEQVRLLLAQQELQKCVLLLEGPRSVSGVTSPELDLARLDTYIGLWQQASVEKNEEQRKRWEQLTVAAVAAIEQEHGEYWGRRAELRLLEHAGSRGGAPSNLDVLERTADELYRKENFTEAMKAYDQAADLALAGGFDEVALQLSYKAALVVQQQGDLDEFINRLVTLALRLRKQPTAAPIHMLAVRNIAAVMKDNAQRQLQFRQLLEEHLQFFIAGTTVDQARIWLGALVQREGKWDEALVLYVQVTSTHPQFLVVLQQLQLCWDQKWAAYDDTELAQQPHPLTPVIDYCKSLMTTDDGQWLKLWDPVSRQAALVYSRFALRLPQPMYDEIGTILALAAQGDTKPAEEWLSAANTIRIVALVAQGRGEQASELVQALGESSPQRWLEMLQQLAEIAETAPTNVQQQIAKLQLNTISELQGKLGDVNVEYRLQWDLLHADASIMLGNEQSGYTLYARIASGNLKRGDIQQRYAEALLLSNTEMRLREALVQWRRVLVGHRPRTDQWYAAKLALAEIYIRLGEREEAHQRIRYLKATSGLGNATWTKKFQELLNRE
jgi:tetratricopeptide (TPR) repeat protein